MIQPAGGSLVECLSRSRIAPLLCVYAVIVVLYAGCLHNGLIWDDITFFRGLRLQDDALYLRHAFLEPRAVFDATYFRPLSLAAMIAEIRADETAVFAHAANLGVFMLNTTLVIVLCQRWFRRYAHPQAVVLGWLAGLLYAVHPLQAEPVNWISGQFDLLMTSCLLVCLCIESSALGTLPKTLALSAAFFCALCCKETAIVLLPVLLCLDGYRTVLDDTDKRDLRSLMVSRVPLYAGLAVTAVGYLILRHHGLGALLPPRPGADTIDFSHHLLLVLASTGMYLERIVVPFLDFSPILAFRSRPQLFVDHCILGGIFLAIPALLFAGRRRVAAIAMVCFIVTLLPVMNIVVIPARYSDISDRYLHFPLAVLLLVAGSALCARRPVMPMRRVKVLLPFIALLLVFGATTVKMNESWKSDADFWDAANRYNPENPVLRMYYLVKLSLTGNVAAVIDESQKAYTTFRDPLFAILLGEHLIIDGQTDHARNLLTSLVKGELPTPQLHDILVQLAFIQAESGKLENAAQLLAQAQSLEEGMTAAGTRNDALVAAFIDCRRPGGVASLPSGNNVQDSRETESLFHRHLSRRLAACRDNQPVLPGSSPRS